MISVTVDTHIYICVVSGHRVITVTVHGCDQEECQNYIRVIARQAHRRLLVCGTNAYRPFCRIYKYVQVF